jgi:hypothetical protein
MNQTESQTSGTSRHSHHHSQNNIQICNDCITLMRSAAEKCREWSEESTSLVCKGGLGTSAFVCDSLASSMEACMHHMDMDGAANEMTEEPDMKKDCCS